MSLSCIVNKIALGIVTGKSIATNISAMAKGAAVTKIVCNSKDAYRLRTALQVGGGAVRAPYTDILDLCQYFGHKKLKDYADFLNSRDCQVFCVSFLIYLGRRNNSSRLFRSRFIEVTR